VTALVLFFQQKKVGQKLFVLLLVLQSLIQQSFPQHRHYRETRPKKYEKSIF
jgi:hypothetical protein